MNYELALKLKNAGFPLKKVGCHECDEGRIRVDGKEGTIYLPTLEELIEECGDDFGALVKLSSFGFEGWEASEKNLRTWRRFKGKSSKEAVANLCLYLNEK